MKKTLSLVAVACLLTVPAFANEHEGAAAEGAADAVHGGKPAAAKKAAKTAKDKKGHKAEETTGHGG